MTGFIETTLSDELIQNYRDDLDFQNLIDLVQKDFECCGISSSGYRDWSKNPYFNCTKNREDNPSVERCGVPFSCCLKDVQRSLSPDDNLVNIMCGFGVQELPGKDVVTKVPIKCFQNASFYLKFENLALLSSDVNPSISLCNWSIFGRQTIDSYDVADPFLVVLVSLMSCIFQIHTLGCIPKMQQYFQQNLITVGGIALGVALAQLLVIWLSRTLEGQIENQRALWKYNT